MVERQWEASRQSVHQRLLGSSIDRRRWPQSLHWDWKSKAQLLGQNGTYGACGMILFDRVVERSIDEGFRGRVGLHALPQAEAFYQDKCGMTPLGKDASKQDLMYFERF